MGTNDLVTARDVSDRRGISTVETNSIKKDAAFDGILEYGTESTSSTRRNLLNPDEIMRMSNDEQIIMIRGQKPFKCKKLRYWEYGLGKNVERTMIEEYIPKTSHIIKPIIEENIAKKLPSFEEFLRGRK